MSPARALSARATRTFRARSKYGAVPTLSHGIRFHSAAEARRYDELVLLQRAGQIHGLALQVRFPLCVEPERRDHARQCVGTYIADFTYCEHGSAALVVEDVKGMKTALYKWKKRHMMAQYGIDIKEVQQVRRR